VLASGVTLKPHLRLRLFSPQYLLSHVSLYLDAFQPFRSLRLSALFRNASHLFSCTYKLLLPQPLCFHIHADCRVPALRVSAIARPFISRYLRLKPGLIWRGRCILLRRFSRHKAVPFEVNVAPTSHSHKRTKSAAKKSAAAPGKTAPAKTDSPAALAPKSNPQPRAAAAVGSNKLKVALVGFGTVGRSVVKILCQDAHGPLQLTHICNRNVEKKKVDWVPSRVQWTDSIDALLSSDADVIVELVGGLAPAGDWIRKALRSGKSVVTANKLLIAESGPELLKLAREFGRRLEFGASVAGGIPAIVAIQEGLAGDRLSKIEGILNGTCNFILTKMEAKGASFAEALKEAQELGFAEANPRDDVEGFDARAKLVILTQAGLRLQVRSDQIPCWPIYTVDAVDFIYARELDCTIRQISLAKKETANGGVHLFAAVRPALVPSSSLIAHVEGSQNLVTATGEFVGEIALSGFGAGGDPTAVAVVSDLHAILRQSESVSGATASRAIAAASLQVPESVSGEFTVPHYLRFVVRDRPGIVAEVAGVLSKYHISIDALLQKPGYPHSALPFTMTLEPCSTAVLEQALAEVARLDFHVQPLLCLPILQG
jgi:homoserine dehydrogenase